MSNFWPNMKTLWRNGNIKKNQSEKYVVANYDLEIDGVGLEIMSECN